MWQYFIFLLNKLSFATETIYGRKPFKDGNYMRKYGIYFSPVLEKEQDNCLFISFVKSYFKVSIDLGLYLVLDPIDTKKYILAKQIACILAPKMYYNPFLRSILIFVGTFLDQSNISAIFICFYLIMINNY